MKTTHRILIIDDEEAILFSFKKLLRSPRVEVDVCMEMEEAFAMIAAKQYDAVLTDYRLSHSESNEGLEILRYVKGIDPTVPVILLTGYGSDEIKERVLTMGAFGYFDKPIRITELYSILQQAGIPVEDP